MWKWTSGKVSGCDWEIRSAMQEEKRLNETDNYRNMRAFCFLFFFSLSTGELDFTPFSTILLPNPLHSLSTFHLCTSSSHPRCSLTFILPPNGAFHSVPSSPPSRPPLTSASHCLILPLPVLSPHTLALFSLFPLFLFSLLEVNQ